MIDLGLRIFKIKIMTGILYKNLPSHDDLLSTIVKLAKYESNLIVIGLGLRIFKIKIMTGIRYEDLRRP